MADSEAVWETVTRQIDGEATAAAPLQQAGDHLTLREFLTGQEESFMFELRELRSGPSCVSGGWTAASGATGEPLQSATPSEEDADVARESASGDRTAGGVCLRGGPCIISLGSGNGPC